MHTCALEETFDVLGGCRLTSPGVESLPALEALDRFKTARDS